MLKRIIFCFCLLVFGLLANYFKGENYFSFIAFLVAFALCGYGVVWAALKNLANIFKGKFGYVFDENVLMSIACFGAFALGESAEAAAIMVFYMIGEYFNDYAITRSKDGIAALLALRPSKVRLFSDGKSTEILAKNAKIGDVVEIRAGERVGLDCKVIFGNSFVDTSAITGESVPRQVGVGEILLAGFIVSSGVLKAKVKAIESESALAKISALVESANVNKSRHERFITRFARVYTPIVVVAATFIAFLAPLIFGGGFELWINRALIFLVISCPCALVISVPLAFFAGIGAASRAGILFRSSQILDTLASVKTFIFDKTGTLTKGVFELSSICPDNLSKKEFLANCAHISGFSNHPISKSLIKAHKNLEPNCEFCAKNNVNNAQISELAGLGIKANIDKTEILLGNSKLLEKFGVNLPNDNCSHFGSLAHLAINGEYKGYAVISDEIKEDAKDLINELKENEISCFILSGDNEKSVKIVADEIGISNFKAELLPQQKMEFLESELENALVAFVGDGINDAAALARASVGIAINGQDIAVEAAGVVLLHKEIKAISTALKIAKRTRRIAWENIIFALSLKLGIMALGAVGLVGIWAAVFADVGVSLLCVLNAMRAGKFNVN